MFAYTIDFLFLLDIFVNFFSAIQDSKFELHDDRCVIAKEYLKGWFIIDLLAIIPFDLIFMTSDLSSFVRVARIGKLYKLIKITRLLRLLKIFK